MSERTSERPTQPEPSDAELEEILGNLEFFLEMEEAGTLPLEDAAEADGEIDE